MKRKFLTLTMAGVLCAACAFGATACKNDEESDNNGSHVPDVGVSIRVSSEEEWNAAFEKTISCRNYTQSTYHVLRQGLYDVNDYSKYIIYTETGRDTAYIVGDELYAKTSVSSNYMYNNEPFDEHEELREIYQKKEETVEYIANRVNGDEWKVFVPNHPEVYFGLDTPDFSSFEFKNGKYIGNILMGEDVQIEVTATVKINAEGYVSYINLKYGVSSFEEIACYNFGSTTYTMPEDAKKAVEDYKAANG